MPGLIFLILALLCGGACALEVQALHANRTPGGSRLVFDLSGPLQYAMIRRENPPRVVLDFKGAKARRLLSLESQISLMLIVTAEVGLKPWSSWVPPLQMIVRTMTS